MQNSYLNLYERVIKLKKILLIKHGSLGDIAFSLTSVIYDIKNHFNKHKIDLLTTSRYIKLFQNSNFLNEILVDNRGGLSNDFINIKIKIIFDLK